MNCFLAFINGRSCCRDQKEAHEEDEFVHGEGYWYLQIEDQSFVYLGALTFSSLYFPQTWVSLMSQVLMKHLETLADTFGPIIFCFC